MCGIFGFSRLTENTLPLIPSLAYEMSDRGKDSWGCSDGINLYKSLGNIIHNHKSNYLDWVCESGIIFHTRGASTGTNITIENAHPHAFESKLVNITDNTTQSHVITGIHNGYINNHFGLKQKYPDRDNFGVDTRHIFKHICDDNDTNELSGSGVIAWYKTVVNKTKADNHTDEHPSFIRNIISNTLFLSRFSSASLYVCQLSTGEVVFASTKSSVEHACSFSGATIAHEIGIDEGKYYSVFIDTVNGDWIIDAGDMSFGKNPAVYVAPASVTYQVPINHNSSYNHRGGAAGLNPFQPHHRSLLIRMEDNYDKCPNCLIDIDPEIEAMCTECYTSWINGEISSSQMANSLMNNTVVSDYAN